MTEDIFRIVVTAAVALAALAFVVQAAIVFAIYRTARKTQQKTQAFMNEVAPVRGEGEPGPLTLREARDRFEQAFVLRTLERENWNQSRAARSLGVHRNTLLARLQAWGFQREEPGPAPVKGRATGTGSS